VLGLELFSRSSIVIDQSKAGALATTELVVETVDLSQTLIKKEATSCDADPTPLQGNFRNGNKSQARHRKQKHALKQKTGKYIP